MLFQRIINVIKTLGFRNEISIVVQENFMIRCKMLSQINMVCMRDNWWHIWFGGFPINHDRLQIRRWKQLLTSGDGFLHLAKGMCLATPFEFRRRMHNRGWSDRPTYNDWMLLIAKEIRMQIRASRLVFWFLSDSVFYVSTIPNHAAASRMNHHEIV